MLPPDPQTYKDTTQIYPDLGSRRFYAFGLDGWVAAYSLDSMRPLGRGANALTLPGSFASVAMVDAGLGSLFVASRTAGAASVGVDQVVINDNGDIERAAHVDLSARLSGDVIVGMYRAPGTKALWLLSESTATNTSAGGGAGVRITEIDLAKLGEPEAVAWSAALPECPRAVHDAAQRTPAALGYVPDKNALYFGCANIALATLPQSPPTVRGAARLTLNGDPRRGPTATPLARLELFPRDGNFANALSAFDPASGRLAMVAQGGGNPTSIYIFDAHTDTYVGAVAGGAGVLRQMGIDPIHGRMYAAGYGPGLIAADIRATPARQGQAFGEYSTFSGGASDARVVDWSTLAVDPATSRAFMRFTGTDEFLILRDRIPKYAPPPAGNLDGNTVDVEEGVGRTAATYAAAGQGYGLRVRQVGGQYALQVNYLGMGGQVFPLGTGTREFRGAYLNHLGTNNQEAAASAVAADRDDTNTGADMSRHPTWPNGAPDLREDIAFPPGADPFQPMVPWPYDDAQCIDLQGEPKKAEESGASASCNREDRVATASAILEPVSANGVTVGSSSLNASAKIERARGAITVITSSVRDIDVLGALKIGEVTATSTTKAHGRPRTTSAEYTRVIRDVKLDGRQLCDEAGCDEKEIADAINSRFAGRVVVQFPKPYKLATPWGYAAVVQRSVAEQFQEMLLNEQPPDRVEVPGIVITISHDGYRPARTVFEGAAVQSDARYGITVLDDGFGPDSTVDRDLLQSLSDGGLLGEGGTGPLFGGGAGVGGEGFGAPDRDGAVGPSFFGTRPLGLIWNGLRGMRGVLPVWAVLLAPVYLSARRWLLLQRSQLISRGGV